MKKLVEKLCDQSFYVISLCFVHLNENTSMPDLACREESVHLYQRRKISFYTLLKLWAFCTHDEEEDQTFYRCVGFEDTPS